MNPSAYLSQTIQSALQNDPPGEWMPPLPQDCIRLSSGYPDPRLVPTDALQQAVTELLQQEKDLPLHYLGSPSAEKLQTIIRQRAGERGMKIGEAELLITAGACQGIDLLARILIDPETIVAVESPTYMEALEIFQNYTDKFITVPVDEQGMQTDVLEKMLQKRQQQNQLLPKVLYTIPTFQNPTGTTMTKVRREHLLQLAAQYDFIIIEDDAYGELHFHEPVLSLKALDYEGRVLHLGSLSKVVAPGLRIGWIAADAAFITAASWFKKDLDHPFAQAVMTTYLQRINLEERLSLLRSRYQEKAAVLIAALKEHFPTSVSWYLPAGGYFVWIKLPGVDTAAMLPDVLQQGTAYVPGKYFFLDKEYGKEYLRLSFSFESDEQLERGAAKLAKVYKSYL